MALKKTGENKWRIDIRLGRQNRHREVFYGTEEDARMYHDALKEELRNNRQEFHPYCLLDIAGEYFQWCQMHQSPKTVKDKKRMAEHLLSFFGKMRFDSISQKNIEFYKRKRLAEVRPRKGYDGHREINRELMLLTHMSKWAFKQGYSASILRDVRMLPYRADIPTPLSKSEINRFLKAAKEEPFYYALFLCLYHGGMRKNETVNLRWEDISFEDNTITVKKAKGGKQRRVPMTMTLRAALECLKENGNTGYVFTSPRTGKPISNLKRAIKRIARRAGISKRCYPHLFRHSFATHLLESSTDIRIIQTLLGHEQITTTTIYTKVAAHLLSNTVAKLDECIDVSTCGHLSSVTY